MPEEVQPIDSPGVFVSEFLKAAAGEYAKNKNNEYAGFAENLQVRQDFKNFLSTAIDALAKEAEKSEGMGRDTIRNVAQSLRDDLDHFVDHMDSKFSTKAVNEHVSYNKNVDRNFQGASESTREEANSIEMDKSLGSALRKDSEKYHVARTSHDAMILCGLADIKCGDDIEVYGAKMTLTQLMQAELNEEQTKSLCMISTGRVGVVDEKENPKLAHDEHSAVVATYLVTQIGARKGQDGKIDEKTEKSIKAAVTESMKHNGMDEQEAQKISDKLFNKALDETKTSKTFSQKLSAIKELFSELLSGKSKAQEMADKYKATLTTRAQASIVDTPPEQQSKSTGLGK